MTESPGAAASPLTEERQEKLVALLEALTILALDQSGVITIEHRSLARAKTILREYARGAAKRLG